ncbi:MAG TPA: hypothetical protein PLX87_00345 [Bacteroidales bacterium]|nr:hypothetical protein [Bacteroidales bacterium]HOK73895.1 hypothetical protein [Bacteroidales bacterium]HPP91625.1 hypothetical protein [Bacteroidales bacterium]HQG56635.1 hypothetical protein [Bacteroidales bacterium]
MRKNYSFVLLFIILFITTCRKDNDKFWYSSSVSFKITRHLLEGRKINCLATSNDGTLFVGSENDLYIIRGNNQEKFDLGSPVMDIAVDKSSVLWIGTGGKGLCRLENRKFTWYNKENSGFPRDYIAEVEIDKNGNIWFSSCAHMLGGIGIFNGNKFEFLTPENSPLNQNVISDMVAGEDGAVYIATSGKVGKSNIYRIYNKEWDCLGNENGTFYWIFSFTVSPAGIIYVVEDFSLSSAFETNKVYSFENGNWHLLNKNENPPLIHFSTRVIADKRNFCWLASYDNKKHEAVIYVYNGKSWLKSPDNSFPDDIITTIETDDENNIYIGTYKNGIFILNQ